MTREQFFPFPGQEDIKRAERIATSLLSGNLPREVVEFILEGEVRQGIAFKDSIGSTVIVSDEYVVSISEEYSGFRYLRRIAPFSDN